MTTDLFVRLTEELGREPTEAEMVDAFAKSIDEATDGFVLLRDAALNNIDALMRFQYGVKEVSDEAWNELKENSK